MMKHTAQPTMAMHRMSTISPASGHSLIGSAPSFGQEISSVMI
jgi:hypothetical protein